LKLAAGFLAALAATTCAFSASIVSSSTGLAAPDQTISFTEIALADDTPLTNEYSALGVTFSGFFYNGCPVCVTAPPTGSKPDIGNFAGSNTDAFNTNLALTFAAPQDGVAFNFASNFAPFTFSAFLGGSLVEQFTVNVGDPNINGVNGWGWYGFTGITFDSITIAAGQAMLLDDLQTQASIPEPSSFLLGGLGCAVFFARSRIRRRRSAAK
jgi:hypothetical protein